MLEFQIRQDDGVVLLGKRRSGKTEGIKFLVRELPYKFRVLDVVGNLTELKALPNVEYFLINPHDEKDIDQKLKGIDNPPRMLVLDEGDRYSYGIQRKTLLSDVINIGRNYGVGYIVSARRTATLPKDFVANEDWAFVFRHIYPNDLEVLTEWFELPEERFRDLEPYHFLLFHDGELTAEGVFEI